MAYTPTTWTDQQTKLGPTNLNKIEQGIAAALPNSGTIAFTGQLARDDVGSAFGDSGSFIHLRRKTTGPGPSPGGDVLADLYHVSRGTRASGSFSFGFNAAMTDDSVIPLTVLSVTGAANNGSGLIRITCTGHGFSTNDWIAVYGVGGTTEANGAWQVTVINANTFDLQGSAFSHAYTSGGNATNRPGLYGGFVTVIPRQTRGGLTGTAANADDVVGYGVFNGSPNNSTATAAYNVNRNSVFGASTEFFQGLEIEANCTYGVRIISACTWGIDLYGGGTATYSSGPIRVNSGGIVYGRNGANNADLPLWRIRSDTDEFEMIGASRISGNLAVTDGVNLIFGTANGTKIGLSTVQKIGFWNATPIVRPTGWTAATNTKTRTTFDTTTVTLPVLAAHVGALMDDLIAMGLIGA